MHDPEAAQRSGGDVYVCVAVALLGVLYAVLTAVLAEQGLVLEAQANFFLPYVVAPFACGAALVARRPQLAAVIGGLTAFGMVGAFYAATQATSPFRLSSWGIKFWLAAALPAGAVAAVVGRASAARLARSKPLQVVFALLVAGLVLAAWLVGPALYRTPEVLLAGLSTALVVVGLLHLELAWLRNQRPA